MISRRIAKELENLQNKQIPGISLWLDDPSILQNCTGQLIGPENTPYENGKFIFNVIFPSKYPYVPMNISFITKVYHPNISYNGNICIGYRDGIDEYKWTPVLNISKILLHLIDLFEIPQPDDPLEPDIASEYTNNRHEFNRKATEYTFLYAY